MRRILLILSAALSAWMLSLWLVGLAAALRLLRRVPLRRARPSTVLASLVVSGQVRAASGANRRKLLFVVTEDWYFCLHRLPLALAAMEAGMDVSIATNVTSDGDLIDRASISLHRWQLRRGCTRSAAEVEMNR